MQSLLKKALEASKQHRDVIRTMKNFRLPFDNLIDNLRNKNADEPLLSAIEEAIDKIIAEKLEKQTKELAMIIGGTREVFRGFLFGRGIKNNSIFYEEESDEEPNKDDSDDDKEPDEEESDNEEPDKTRGTDESDTLKSTSAEFYSLQEQQLRDVIEKLQKDLQDVKLVNDSEEAESDVKLVEDSEENEEPYNKPSPT